MAPTFLMVRLTLGLILIRSASSKLHAPRTFVKSIDGYRIVPPQALQATAGAILLAEASLGALLLSGIHVQVGVFAAAVLFGIFAAAMLTSVVRGRLVDCGCRGASAPHTVVSPALIIGDLVLAGAALATAIIADRWQLVSRSVWTTLNASPLETVLCFLGGSVLVLSFDLAVVLAAVRREMNALLASGNYRIPVTGNE